MRDLIRLTRPLNLLIVALTMVVMRYGVLGMLFTDGPHHVTALSDRNGSTVLQMAVLLPFRMHISYFVMLVLSTMLIMAGGNVINDYFDTRIDRVNKPHGVIVGRSVKRRVAMAVHWACSGTGLLIGLFVAWRMHQIELAIIPVFAVGALWFYSTTFKRRLLLGNGLVATLSALVPLTVGLYELPTSESASLVLPIHRVCWWIILGYSVFAFVSTLLRELQKDMADVRGDAANGCRTVPIAWGMRAARLLVGFWAIVLIVAIGLLCDRVFTDLVSRIYLYTLVIVPILASASLTWNARDRKQHNQAGNVMKLAMVFAVGYGVLIHFIPA